MTYQDIYDEYCKTKTKKTKVVDWRPCHEMYGVPTIQNAIVVWLENGKKNIYKSKNAK